jgi:hypothetical protein
VVVLSAAALGNLAIRGVVAFLGDWRIGLGRGSGPRGGRANARGEKTRCASEDVAAANMAARRAYPPGVDAVDAAFGYGAGALFQQKNIRTWILSVSVIVLSASASPKFCARRPRSGVTETLLVTQATARSDRAPAKVSRSVRVTQTARTHRELPPRPHPELHRDPTGQLIPTAWQEATKRVGTTMSQQYSYPYPPSSGEGYPQVRHRDGTD